MQEPIERELKILVSKEEYEKLLNSYTFSNPWKQTNTYYDTEDGYIKQKKGAMRIRKIGDKHIFTLKIRTDSITHIELEKEIDCDSIQDIKDKEILDWLKEYEIPMNVRPIISFTTTRQVVELEDAELCADHTDYGNHSDYEIEYEYKTNHDGIKAFNEILESIHIQYTKNCSSKIARAFDYN